MYSIIKPFFSAYIDFCICGAIINNILRNKQFDKRGVAQFGLERLLWEQEVGGSNPLTPTSLR